MAAPERFAPICMYLPPEVIEPSRRTSGQPSTRSPDLHVAVDGVSR